MNIEEVFHYAPFDIEPWRLRQQLEPVGRDDGSGTPWNKARSIEAWLDALEENLCDIIFEAEEQADFNPIDRWAEQVSAQDAVLTFNYDTLAERALTKAGKTWNHGTKLQGGNDTTVCKLHGSIDWLVAHRSQSLSKLELLYEKPNQNQQAQDCGDMEEEYRLWRCLSREQLREWLSGRDLQTVERGTLPIGIGIAGLGTYKQLHEIPGLGPVWDSGMRSLYEADSAIVIGFSMSDFDAMAQMHFADVARQRCAKGNPLRVTVIDPCLGEQAKDRFPTGLPNGGIQATSSPRR